MTSADRSPAWYRQFRRKLTRWYDVHHRVLPWRQTHDPYAIWISETMLQQTQVATVIDYYHRFLARFPDVGSLARADEQSVLKLWAGLGYYRRARQLHAAAKHIVREFDGVFPARFEQILGLPGIGRYTAGAIASFAYDARTPIVEANTLRLFSRLLTLREPPRTPSAQRRLWEFAQCILPAGAGSGRVNQAAMELGSLICTSKKPNCRRCPLASLCPTYELGLEDEIPRLAPKKACTSKLHVAVVIRSRGAFLLRQNQSGEWWQGLWDFPRADLSEFPQVASRFQAQHPESTDNLQAVQAAIAQSLGLSCLPVRHLTTLQHSVTRFRISLFCFQATTHNRSLKGLEGTWEWSGAQTQLPLNAPAQRLTNWLEPSWHVAK